jgi:hypothetical protein
MTIVARDTRARRESGAYPQADGYPRAGQLRIVVVPDRRCLAVDGEGEPGGREFQEAMGAIYGTAYSLHFLLRERGADAHIRPVEALWIRREGEQDWAEGDAAFDPAAWRWTLLMPIPDEATDADIDASVVAAEARRATGVRIEVRTIVEGLVVEAMHVGPYAAEPETIAAMHALAAASGLTPHGPHHEIYLGDPRRSKPENLRTVLRQPVG